MLKNSLKPIIDILFFNAFANYAKDKTTWDNTLDLGYGMMRQGTKKTGVLFYKTDDKIDSKTDGKAEPANKGTGAKATTTKLIAPNTGDDSNSLLWFTIICIALLSLFVVMDYRRKHRE